MPDSREAPVSGVGCLIRSLWMFAGNGLLAYLLFSVVHNPSQPATRTGLAYAATVLAMILIRYADIRFMHGETADGQPATTKHWRRYSIGLLAASLALWGVACMVARKIF